MQGFYSTRGVVTFNDHVFGKDIVVVQEDNAAMLVSVGNRPFKNQLKVGQDIDLGGLLEPGNYLPVITPLVVVGTKMAFHARANHRSPWLVLFAKLGGQMERNRRRCAFGEPQRHPFRCGKRWPGLPMAGPNRIQFSGRIRGCKIARPAAC